MERWHTWTTRKLLAFGGNTDLGLGEVKSRGPAGPEFYCSLLIFSQHLCRSNGMIERIYVGHKQFCCLSPPVGSRAWWTLWKLQVY